MASLRTSRTSSRRSPGRRQISRSSPVGDRVGARRRPDLGVFLREDVLFHDGTPFEASHVVDRFQPEFEDSAPEWLPLSGGTEVTALDDHTVEFASPNPIPALPEAISHPNTGIPHSDAADNEEPIGTGQLRVTDIDRGEQLDTEPFDDYWGETTEYDTVTFNVVLDNSTRVLELESGSRHRIRAPARTDRTSRRKRWDRCRLCSRADHHLRRYQSVPRTHERSRSAPCAQLRGLTVRSNRQRVSGLGEPADLRSRQQSRGAQLTRSERTTTIQSERANSSNNPRMMANRSSFWSATT
ncbi:hypothetical protein D8S78_02870 [Natrialba swarupiae]|nr:hypothetical protein [Natrialba swarupiae]